MGLPVKKKAYGTFLTFFVFSCPLLCGMGGMRNSEELITLKEQGSEEDVKQKDLEGQEASFRSVKEALISKKIQVGLSGKIIVQRHGRPLAVSAVQEGEKWFYFARNKKWLECPRICLYFNKNGFLQRWECAYTKCESR